MRFVLAVLVTIGSISTFLAAGFALLMLSETFDRAESAPQQAAGATMAAAIAIIPYVATRAISLLLALMEQSSTDEAADHRLVAIRSIASAIPKLTIHAEQNVPRVHGMSTPTAQRVTLPTSIICPSCYHDNPLAAKACLRCGKQLTAQSEG